VTLSVGIARRDRPEHADWFPHETHRIRWEIAYPRPFGELVRERAAHAGIEPALAWAIMREESGFHADIESWANALGLMQLLEPTARWLARDDGGPTDRGSLLTPERNIELGTRMLGSLQSRLEHPALAIAAYNAGEASVQRWLRDHGTLPLDELVESIPYRQTRRYTQRVLASLAAYRELYGPEPLVLPLTLPPTSRVADR
jgi:soluble lytic murein transglycosylase